MRAFALVATAALCCTSLRPSYAFQPADLRVDLPANAEVLIENRRGGVSIEVWDEQYVSVSAVTEGESASASGRSSPVRLERSESLLSIGVTSVAGRRATRTATTTTPRVDLKLRLPAHARAKIFTGGGAIEVSGALASLDAQTVSGDIRLDLPAPPDAELTAHSLNGSVLFKSGLAGLVGAATVEQPLRKKFQARLGAGARAVRLFSGRGQIRIGALAESSPASARTAASGARMGATGERAAGAQALEVDANPRPGRTPAMLGSGIGVEGRGASVAQSSRPADEPEEVDEGEVVRVETELVTLNASVIDRSSGRGLAGLSQNDFRLYEDGAAQQIAHFQSSSAPFDLLLLIDLSGSTVPVTNLIRAAALRFVNAARTQDRIGVVTFASATSIVSPLTTDREALRVAIGAMESPKGDTRLYDALGFAMSFLERDAAPTRRRAVVLMSDGLDSTLPNVTGVGSTLSFEELRSRVAEFDGVLYSIWTSTEYEAFSPEDIQPETFDLVNKRMQELAEAGGGVFYDVERLEDLAGTYERVVADLGTLYSLSYKPTNKTRDGRWRAIRLTLPNLPNAVARAKRGYFAK